MVTSALILNVEESETPVSSPQPQKRVCSHTLLQVLMGLLVAFTLAVAGGVFWMQLSQDSPQQIWTVRFTGTNTTFTSPRNQTYVIFGKVFTNGHENKNCQNSFLLKKSNTDESKTIGDLRNVSELFIVDEVYLEEDSTLIVELNCNGLKIDTAKSVITVLQQNLLT